MQESPVSQLESSSQLEPSLPSRTGVAAVPVEPASDLALLSVPAPPAVDPAPAVIGVPPCALAPAVEDGARPSATRSSQPNCEVSMAEAAMSTRVACAPCILVSLIRRTDRFGV